MKCSTENKTPALESVIKIAEETNHFDYNKMMEDFELALRHETHLKKIKQKWVTEGKKYNKKIREMKNDREQQYKEKNALLMDKLSKKDAILITALTAKRQAKSAEKQRIIEEMIEKEKEAKKKVEEFHNDQENQRLREGQRTKEKMSLFESQHEIKKKEAHDKIIDELNKKERRFSSNFEKLLDKEKEIEKMKEEQAFKKYEAFYWHRRDLMKKQKDKKTKSKSKLAEKEERIEELQKDHDRKRKEIIKKLESISFKKEQYEKQKAVEYEKAKEKREEMIRKMLENKEALKADRQSLREEILENQNNLLGKAIGRESVIEKKRINAHEITVVKQMTLEKNLSAFNIRMNKLNNESILKKPFEERLMMFKEMKRREAERKKKEEEDKQIKS